MQLSSPSAILSTWETVDHNEGWAKSDSRPGRPLIPMFKKWFSKKPDPLTGAPAVRRQKSYSAQSGYVYQYFYGGQRPWHAAPGTEFVFDVSADRKTSAPVSVFLGEAALTSWQQEHGRTLGGTERYAIAKMALFQAFDVRENPEKMKEPIEVRGADVSSFLDALNID